MKLPEKIWILEHKVDGESVSGYEIFNTETDAWSKAVDRVFDFVDIVENSDSRYKGCVFKQKECKVEVYVDNSTFLWEWYEIPSKDFLKGFGKNGLRCDIDDSV